MLWAAALLPVLTLYACAGNYKHNHSDSSADTQATAPAEAADAAAAKDTTAAASAIPEKRIKTADLRLRVDNVVQTAVRMEQLVTRAGGIVEESDIKQSPGHQTTARYTSDSLRRVSWYSPEATMRLRVPVSMMDSVVNALTGMAVFVDSRTRSDKDVALTHLQNKLLNDAARTQDRPVNHTKANKELDVRQYEEESQRGAITRTIENLGIDNQVAYSTLTVYLHQPDLAIVSIVPDPERMARSYFWTDALLALRNGLEGFRAVLMFFLNIWPLLLTAAFTWYAYRRWYPRLRAATQQKPNA